MDTLEYWFGTGDGEVTTWQSGMDTDVDGDGVNDAVRLDFDGDGLVDDVMWDSDGDGRADRVVLDLGGPEERWFADPVGDGVWGLEVDQAPAPPVPSVTPLPESQPSVWRSVDHDGDGTTDAVADLDGDGIPDAVLLSTRGDGRYDTILVAGDDPARMSVRLSDTDGDGRLDTVRGDP
ncbi:hypothetical protein [Prescottella subtropica]|uniref:hypothetical protein n=1 Tax=Prescottella subtropica TaxID=2545757 RepID=UPI0010F8F1D8|nr:hypothetical protein [Prescottella subtropica]